MMHDREREFEALAAEVASQSRPKLDYSQLSHSDFLCVYIYLLQVMHQAIYMMVFRARGLRPEEIPRKQAMAWRREVTIPVLREAYKSCPQPGPIRLLLDCHLELRFVYEEMSRRGKDIPLAKTMVLLDQDYGDVANDPATAREAVRRLGLHKRLRGDQPDATSSIVSPPSRETYQNGLLAMFEVWREPRFTAERIGPRPPFPAPDEMLLPEEREFWDGPMARTWETSLKAILDKQIPIFSGELDELIAQRAPNYASNTRKTDTRRRENRNRKSDRIAAEVHSSQPKLADEALAYARDRESNEKQVGRLYRRARKLYGQRGVRFLKALTAGKTKEEASTDAGFSRPTGDKLLKKLSKDFS